MAWDFAQDLQKKIGDLLKVHSETISNIPDSIEERFGDPLESIQVIDWIHPDAEEEHESQLQQRQVLNQLRSRRGRSRGINMDEESGMGQMVD